MIIENEGQGLIFDNSEAKDKNENAPDFTGQIKVGGEQYRIALWYKDFANGEGFSVNVQPAEGNYSSADDEDEDEDYEPTPRKRTASRSTAKPRAKAPSRSSNASKPAHRKPSRR